MHLNSRTPLLALVGSFLLSGLFHLTALAQDLPTPTPVPITPTPLHPAFVPPPGDTTILVIGAVILALIGLGAVVWASRRAPK